MSTLIWQKFFFYSKLVSYENQDLLCCLYKSDARTGCHTFPPWYLQDFFFFERTKPILPFCRYLTLLDDFTLGQIPCTLHCSHQHKEQHSNFNTLKEIQVSLKMQQKSINPLKIATHVCKKCLSIVLRTPRTSVHPLRPSGLHLKSPVQDCRNK